MIEAWRLTGACLPSRHGSDDNNPFLLALLPEAGSPKELTLRQERRYAGSMRPSEETSEISAGAETGRASSLTSSCFLSRRVSLRLFRKRRSAATTSSGSPGAEIADAFLLSVYVPALQSSLTASVASLLQKEAGAAGN